MGSDYHYFFSNRERITLYPQELPDNSGIYTYVNENCYDSGRLESSLMYEPRDNCINIVPDSKDFNNDTYSNQGWHPTVGARILLETSGDATFLSFYKQTHDSAISSPCDGTLELVYKLVYASGENYNGDYYFRDTAPSWWNVLYNPTYGSGTEVTIHGAKFINCIPCHERSYLVEIDGINGCLNSVSPTGQFILRSHPRCTEEAGGSFAFFDTGLNGLFYQSRLDEDSEFVPNQALDEYSGKSSPYILLRYSDYLKDYGVPNCNLGDLWLFPSSGESGPCIFRDVNIGTGKYDASRVENNTVCDVSDATFTFTELTGSCVTLQRPVSRLASGIHRTNHKILLRVAREYEDYRPIPTGCRQSLSEDSTTLPVEGEYFCSYVYSSGDTHYYHRLDRGDGRGAFLTLGPVASGFKCGPSGNWYLSEVDYYLVGQIGPPWGELGPYLTTNIRKNVIQENILTKVLVYDNVNDVEYNWEYKNGMYWLIHEDYPCNCLSIHFDDVYTYRTFPLSAIDSKTFTINETRPYPCYPTLGGTYIQFPDWSPRIGYEVTPYIRCPTRDIEGNEILGTESLFPFYSNTVLSINDLEYALYFDGIVYGVDYLGSGVVEHNSPAAAQGPVPIYLPEEKEENYIYQRMQWGCYRSPYSYVTEDELIHFGCKYFWGTEHGGLFGKRASSTHEASPSPEQDGYGKPLIGFYQGGNSFNRESTWYYVDLDSCNNMYRSGFSHQRDTDEPLPVSMYYPTMAWDTNSGRYYYAGGYVDTSIPCSYGTIPPCCNNAEAFELLCPYNSGATIWELFAFWRGYMCSQDAAPNQFGIWYIIKHGAGLSGVNPNPCNDLSLFTVVEG